MAQNMEAYSSLLPKNTRLLLMVKANAYGTSIVEVAQQMAPLVDYLGTAYSSNAIALRSSGIDVPIMVMAPEPSDIALLLAKKLEPVLYSLAMVKAAIALNQPIHAHIELDTGMKRLGLQFDELDRANKLLGASNVKVVSVFSHLVAPSEPPHDAFTHRQAQLFEKGYAVLTNNWPIKPWKHLASSGALARFPQYQYDMVRLGIGFYGYDPTHELKSIRPMAKLQAKILQITQVAKNETIGYSRKGKLTHKAKIATLSVGYGDGYLRIFGNGKAHVHVNGRYAPTVGNICMDLMMIDVSGINCSEGDIVELFGNHVTIAELAEIANSIPYEILTNISPRVERVLVPNF